jgi:GNAT superfamily N-acetyltransferase
MTIEKFKSHHADAVSNIIRRNLLEINSKDYPKEKIEEYVKYFSPEQMLQNSNSRHIFVAIENEKVVGTASLGNFGSEESPNYFALAVFIHPEFHSQGIGTGLMNKVENKAKELGAKKITVPAGITSKLFYKKLNYEFKDGLEEPDKDGNYLMEKALA